ncbi:MAG TPA: hypothetical protein VKB47_08620 [Terracidiphilus sp.]|nr:hypothetical protein [Terracidiphilus sp.]
MTTTIEQVFAGADYQPERDAKRLTTQIERVCFVMRDQAWRSIAQLCDELRRLWPTTRFPENSVQAQLRNLRKLGHTVDRRYVVDGLYEYRVIEKVEAPGAGDPA